MTERSRLPEYGTPVVISLTRVGRSQGQGNPCRNGTGATGTCSPTGLGATGTCASGIQAGSGGCNAGTGGDTLPPIGCEVGPNFDLKTETDRL